MLLLKVAKLLGLHIIEFMKCLKVKPKIAFKVNHAISDFMHCKKLFLHE
jgi:predicted regulator of amino acid metabolism with ACT domain